ncbi:MAG: GMC family oxidoreductase [Proteobacteria bacterium]|nr:GMC family oxidoreductase [Pseudomonadota bacterium]
MSEDANVVIVGSGVAGSLVASLLIDAGVSGITILEAGPDIVMKDPRSWFDVVTTGVAPYESLYDSAADYNSEGANPWVITGSRIIGRGGSTIHWGGWCPRFMPEDFALKSNTGLGIDWPYGYKDLEPYYNKAEAYLGVAGVEAKGQRDWRSQPYPMAGPTLPLTAKPIVTALADKGYIFGNMAIARNTVAHNGQSQCITTGTCHYCPIGARFTGDQPLNRVAGEPNVKLIVNAPATRLIMSDKQTVAAVEYRDMTTGNTHKLSATAVYLCAGAFETPKLLQLSTSEYWPAGIGNDNDLVGRYLVANPYLYCRGGTSTNPQRLQQELNFPNLASRQWDTPEEQAHGKFLMNMSYDAPLIHPGKLMYQGMPANEIDAAVTGPLQYELQGALSPLPNYENRVSVASGTTRFGLPRTLIFTPETMVPQSTIDLNGQRMTGLFEQIGYTVSGAGAYPQRGDHAASTCRMAASDSEGVVDTSLKVFGTDNLYVASNAAVPTVGAANLTLTTVAAIMKAVDETLSGKPSWASPAR